MPSRDPGRLLPGRRAGEDLEAPLERYVVHALVPERAAAVVQGIGVVDEAVQEVEAVAVHPGDAVRHAVDLGVVLRARQRRGAQLDADHAVPVA
ncbi:hypothetical protein VPNG_05318 [Cytospora leucostoma]|uniref:Uncharacterized protein n=1 Tax=Cytospora leucostoma TaxID=1230097 RepID=A0A423X516_9PEZI|nr:hypothetical protein VPNG_05318 [Cytospora leucostoma]